MVNLKGVKTYKLQLKDKLYGIEREKLNLILDIWRSYELSLSSHF